MFWKVITERWSCLVKGNAFPNHSLSFSPTINPFSDVSLKSLRVTFFVFFSFALTFGLSIFCISPGLRSSPSPLQ